MDEKNYQYRHHGDCDVLISELEHKVEVLNKRFLPRFTLWILGTSLIIWGFTNILRSRDNDKSEYICPEEMILYPAEYYMPEQIHLSLGSNDTEMHLTYSTKQPADTTVIYKSEDYTSETMYAKGKLTTWTSTESDPKVIEETGTRHMDHYTYRAVLTRLKPRKKYQYEIRATVEPISVMTKKYVFEVKQMSDPGMLLIKIAFFGDLGLINGISIPHLIAQANAYDLVIHNGDFAYDLNTAHGSYGDQFMRLIEPLTSQVPYQTSVGNHEIAEKFLHYDQRFSMISAGGDKINNFYYSYNIGPIHFVAISTEHWYFMDYLGIKPLLEQWEWLKKDLAKANTAEARLARPWIIVYGHRPMYCSGRDRDDCAKDKCLLRTGLPFLGTFNLEQLLFENGVDFGLWSHEHLYERFHPVYNNTVYDNDGSPDHDPKAPIHIISGSAGSQERIEEIGKTAPGSFVRVADYGFMRIVARSRCDIEFEQFSVDRGNGTVVDRVVISKTRHNFPPTSELYMKPINCSSARSE